MEDLIKLYPEAYRSYSNIFSHKYDIGRLNEIHTEVIKQWKKYASKIQKVKFLLIAEAPPWTPENDHIKYFYSIMKNEVHRKNSTLFKALNSAFNLCPNNPLRDLSKKGFLLVDSLPFAVKYTPYIRRKTDYKEMVLKSKSFLESQINSPLLSWSEEVKVAFGFKLNAEVIINQIGSIVLPTGQQIQFNNDMISADGSGFPSSRRIREIYGVE